MEFMKKIKAKDETYIIYIREIFSVKETFLSIYIPNNTIIIFYNIYYYLDVHILASTYERKCGILSFLSLVSPLNTMISKHIYLVANVRILFFL